MDSTVKKFILAYMEKELKKAQKEGQAGTLWPIEFGVGWDLNTLIIRISGFPCDIERIVNFKIRVGPDGFVRGTCVQVDSMHGDSTYSHDGTLWMYNWQWPINYLRNWFGR